MFKNFLKAKTGKEMVEIILLAPFTVFLILYLIANVATISASSTAQTEANELTRAFVTRDNLYDGLVSLSQQIQNYETITVTKIEIINNIDVSQTATLEFATGDRLGNFKSLYNNGNFNINFSDSFLYLFNNMNIFYKNGSYAVITYEKRINSFLGSLTKITLPGKEGERVEIQYLSPNTCQMVSKNVVIG